MYINMMCKCKIRDSYEKDGKIYYSDGTNDNILEAYLFSTKEKLFTFHSGRKRTGQR